MSNLRPFPSGLAMAVLLTAVGAAAAGAASYQQGDRVEVRGRVADASGRPVPGARVRLEAARSRLSVRRLGRVDSHPARFATVTDGRGEYALAWEWHDFYNRFELRVELPSSRSGSDSLVMTALDVTERVAAGSPVAVPVTLEETPALRRHLEFYASLNNQAERQVFQELGPPDRADRLDLGEHEEVTWWYFRAGKAYRFRDERIEEVVSFDPVEPF